MWDETRCVLTTQLSQAFVCLRDCYFRPTQLGTVDDHVIRGGLKLQSKRQRSRSRRSRHLCPIQPVRNVHASEYGKRSDGLFVRCPERQGDDEAVDGRKLQSTIWSAARTWLTSCAFLQLRSNQLSWNPLQPPVLLIASEDTNLYTFDIRKMTSATQVFKGHVGA